MALLSTAQLAAIQKLGQSAMTVAVAIYKREAYAADDSNPFGDDTVTYASTPISTTGWVTPVGSTDFAVDAAQVLSSKDFVLRTAVGVDIDTADKIVISGHTYYVTESGIEETWPEWISSRLKRVE